MLKLTEGGGGGAITEYGEEDGWWG